MPRTPILPALLLTACLATAAHAAEQAAPKAAPPPEAPSAPSVGNETLKPGKPALKPYLAEGAMPDPLKVLSAPPAHHSPLEMADRAAFTTTRSLKGTPRWNLAANDVAEGAAAVLDNYACILGTRIDQARVPATLNLLERARIDLANATRIPKVHFRRLRPFVGNDAPICVQRTQALADSFSYPSGHATQGWAYALILASLVPEKATAILARGRAYGESRIVCGVHWLSDVVAGRLNGSAVFAALVGDAAFRSDMDKARSELRGALAGGGAGPDQAVCQREAEALREPALEF
ncbi:phosphatase PAP2 family protein [Methylobacterium sp. NEAU 140]|uniref:acid phosphatase n=1 Tax=Methylobacterium sp. NEAU 140 TaxID=3064945 RepID=UPI002736E2CB|nr:phosphatase PAP2 family protein [Methylobacterium sp. NEAU 140]MDP4025474.1 phosphatase PAP2 family protein [Methylobacterium sp. NEAU 140]